MHVELPWLDEGEAEGPFDELELLDIELRFAPNYALIVYEILYATVSLAVALASVEKEEEADIEAHVGPNQIVEAFFVVCNSLYGAFAADHVKSWGVLSNADIYEVLRRLALMENISLLESDTLHAFLECEDIFERLDVGTLDLIADDLSNCESSELNWRRVPKCVDETIALPVGLSK